MITTLDGDATIGTPTIGHERPYVGLRPFEASERALFRGRERDAQFLVDKILSAKLTILFAQSGVGKSSLLHTLTIPELKDERCCPVYFNAWAGRDPLGTLKATVVQTLREHNVADPDAGSPSLKDLVRLLDITTGYTTVLVLDQFEELLAAPGEPPAPLRRELAELVRATEVDARIVIALREEFLAALEPFRADMVHLFQSTFRLDRLDDAGITRAIVEPAGLFGVKYQPALLARLLRDLRGSSEDALQDTTTLAVELPMLQLVCNELWSAGKARQLSELTSAMYDELGGAAAIIRRYVTRTMPWRWRDKKSAAHLMKFLAPPSGLKMSYSVADLRAYTKLPRRRIASTLQRLQASRILRVRVLQGEERFELQHDAFIKILVPWRDRVLRRAARIKWMTIGAGLVILAAFAPFAAGYLIDEIDYRREVTSKLPMLSECVKDQGQSAKMLEDITRHLLLRTSRHSRLVELRQVLANHHECLPASYGVDRAGVGFVDSSLPDDWPVRLRYSSSRSLDPAYFATSWHRLARDIATDWGIPVPSRVRLQDEPTMPPRMVELILPGGQKLQLDDVATHEGEAFLSEARLSAAAREFIGMFKSDWVAAPELRYGGPWWVVPRWAMPIVKATGDIATDGSGYLALRLITELQARPELMLTEEAFQLLMRRAAEQDPSAVAEARASRGSKLRQDLVALVRHDMALHHLPMILDLVAQHPFETTSDVVAQQVGAELGSRALPLPSKPLPQQQPGRTPVTAEAPNYYREAGTWLPAPEPPLRIYLGRTLAAQFTNTRDELTPELLDQVGQLRHDITHRFGVEMPGIRFRSYRDLPANAFQIELLNQQPGDPRARVVQTEPATALRTMMIALRDTAEAYRVYWVTSADVSMFLSALNPATRRWIEQRYSPTEIKALARRVIAPSAVELEQRDKAPAGTSISVDPAASWRNARWLVRSLVFWNAVDNINLEGAVTRLRQTQAALQVPPTVDISESRAVAAGVDALIKDRILAAEQLFRAAVKTDRDAAVRVFLSAYASSLRAESEASLRQACGVPTRVTLARDRIGDLEDLTARQRDRQLSLCLFTAIPADLPSAKRQAAMKLLKEFGNADQWPPTEATWFAQQIVATYDPLRDPESAVTAAASFLRSALPRLSARDSDGAIRDIADVCAGTGPKNWCWRLLDEAGRSRPDPSVRAQIALRLGWGSGAAELRKALEWAGPLPNASAWQTESIPAYLLLSRAIAVKSLAEGWQEPGLEETEPVFRRLLASADSYIAQVSYDQLIEVYLSEGRLAEADSLQAAAMKRWPESSSLYIQKFWIDLLAGKTQAAAATARQAELLADKRASPDIDLLFVAALGQVLTRSGAWEYAARRLIGSSHSYVDYIHLMLYTSLTESKRREAGDLLKQRWGHVEPASWPARMREGDESAWREMLIGYAVSAVTREQLLGPLEDDKAFQQSPHAHLPLPRRGLLCEAYFYDALLAKASGDDARMRQSLERTIGTQMRTYFEYRMAKFLLASRESAMVASR